MNRIRLSSAAAALVVLVAGTACGKDTPKAAAAPKVTAALKEWSVTLSETTLKTGKYSFTIKNNGTGEHELIAVKTDKAIGDLPLKDDGDVDEESADLPNATDGPDIGSGKSQVRTINLATPGTYVFMCNLPGHFKQGMHEIVTVTA